MGKERSGKSARNGIEKFGKKEEGKKRIGDTGWNERKNGKSGGRRRVRPVSRATKLNGA